MHSPWYRCLLGHGNCITLSPSLKSSLQTAQVDSSSAPVNSTSFSSSTTFLAAGGGPLSPDCLCNRLSISLMVTPTPKSLGFSRCPPNEPVPAPPINKFW